MIDSIDVFEKFCLLLFGWILLLNGYDRFNGYVLEKFIVDVDVTFIRVREIIKGDVRFF